ncbi:MAG: pilus (MSHA type) biogenesis protein MshL [Gammaproteobacteria bacterium]|nr:MAG: pilus (MSHA type) biogenesis protein MshL [Gammaproteobacteria bacterium]
MNKSPTLIHLALIITSLLLGSCENLPDRRGDVSKDINAVLQEGALGDQSPPPEVTAALLPPLVTGLAEHPVSKPETRFDIAVSSVPAREFFMGLVQDTEYNMVVHPDVTGNLSLTLKNVTLRDVMETVNQVYGYEYEETPIAFRVLPIRLKSRIFQVNYLNIIRTGSSKTRVSSGEISQSGAQSGTLTTNKSLTVNSSEIETETLSDFWTELRTAVTAIVGSGQGRSVIVNPQTGLLVVRALPAELREVEAFLAATQENLNRQVILEAKIIEVILNDQFQSGINWAGIIEAGRNKFVLGSQRRGRNLFTSDTGFISGSSLQNASPGVDFPVATAGNPGALVNALDSATFNGVFSLALNLNDFVAFIDLLEGQGSVNVLSSPRVATLNNQKAVIKVGSDEFFVTNVGSNVISSAANATTTVNVRFTPFFSGIALDVTPQIDAQGMITLHVHPKISEVTSSPREIPVNGGQDTATLALARSTVRESDSIVRARSGQIIVIGGLMQNKVREDHASTPGLGDLPFVGSAFRHTKQFGVKSELVILLKPIVVNDDSWQQSIEGTKDRIQKINRGFRYSDREPVFGNQAERPRATTGQ